VFSVLFERKAASELSCGAYQWFSQSQDFFADRQFSVVGHFGENSEAPIQSKPEG
jgi:hypothetical protein